MAATRKAITKSKGSKQSVPPLKSGWIDVLVHEKPLPPSEEQRGSTPFVDIEFRDEWLRCRFTDAEFTASFVT